METFAQVSGEGTVTRLYKYTTRTCPYKLDFLPETVSGYQRLGKSFPTIIVESEILTLIQIYLKRRVN